MGRSYGHGGYVIAWLAIVMPAFAQADVAAAEPTKAAARQTMLAVIQDDWAAQETRRGRTPDDPQAIRDVLAATNRLLVHLRDFADGTDLDDEATTLDRLSREAATATRLATEARVQLYRDIRHVTRSLVARHPLVRRPVLFLKRRRFICQMLHEYIGYYYNYDGIHGGGVYVLDKPGVSFQIRDLIRGRLPRGNYATLALSHDAHTVYFAFCELTDAERSRVPQGNHHGFPAARDVPAPLNYYSTDRACFNIFALERNSGELQQLTDGREDDFNPCPLPDGSVVFVSSRRGGFCRCDNPFEPIPTTTLHTMRADGSDQRILSYHETNEWHPSLLRDGRIVYCRWDYVDRSAAHFHGLWVSNPDGSNPEVLFGNYTKRISACFQPRAIPNSNRIVFVAGAHHADVGGSLVLFDPTRAQLDPNSGEDEFASLEVLTPDVRFPEAPDHWPADFFHSPWPLSEDAFLVSFSFDPLSGMGSGVLRDTQTGIYYLDRFGNMELLYRDPEISSMNPLPLFAEPRRPIMSSPLESTLGPWGEFYLVDVTWSVRPMPANRPIRELRIFQVLPKSETHIANLPRIGYANAEPARALLGSVPVEADGSAYFRAPAGKPFYFQAVDADGRAVQSMRSITYLQPGERRSCVGCHERPDRSPPPRMTLALRRGPSHIEPGPDGTRPLSFPRLVQPILDTHCVRCHDGNPGEETSELQLTGEALDCFTRSYVNLRPFVRWYEWGGETIQPTITEPGRMGADESRLVQLLDETHRDWVRLSDSERRHLYLWLDANAPFYGTYSLQEQLAQQRGEAVPLPALQ